MLKFMPILFALLLLGCDASKKEKYGTAYEVTRRCDLAQATKAGNFVFVHPLAKSKNFPVPEGCNEGEKVDVYLFGPKQLNPEGGRVTTDQAHEGMSRIGCQAVDWTLLLPLAEKHPELQLQHKILGLASAFRDLRGRTVLPLLSSHKKVRSLHMSLSLNNPNGQWQYWDEFRFAATCK